MNVLPRPLAQKDIVREQMSTANSIAILDLPKVQLLTCQNVWTFGVTKSTGLDVCATLLGHRRYIVITDEDLISNVAGLS